MTEPNVRRLLRVSRLCNELGHGDDVAAALDEMKRLRAENAALKRDLEYARSGLTNGRTRMREDNERLTEALSDLLAAHAMRASCQAGLVKRCKCMPCATARARDVLGTNACSTESARSEHAKRRKS